MPIASGGFFFWPRVTVGPPATFSGAGDNILETTNCSVPSGSNTSASRRLALRVCLHLASYFPIFPFSHIAIVAQICSSGIPGVRPM